MTVTWVLDREGARCVPVLVLVYRASSTRHARLRVASDTADEGTVATPGCDASLTLLSRNNRKWLRRSLLDDKERAVPTEPSRESATCPSEVIGAFWKPSSACFGDRIG
eukprot:scaffold1733_cov391-Prasinococcus_capsulatus_cf.AAC.8